MTEQYFKQDRIINSGRGFLPETKTSGVTTAGFALHLMT